MNADLCEYKFLFNQDKIFSASAPVNIEGCIFVIGFSTNAWRSCRNCSSTILLLWKVWELTNSVLILLYLPSLSGDFILHVYPSLSLYLYWDVLLSVLNYTFFWILSSPSLPGLSLLFWHFYRAIFSLTSVYSSKDIEISSFLLIFQEFLASWIFCFSFNIPKWLHDDTSPKFSNDPIDYLLNCFFLHL